MPHLTLCYRKIIDVTSQKPWDKLVFEDSYREFRMQAAYFNQENKYRTFGEILYFVPAAERLHFLVSGAVRGYVQQLNNVVPDVVNNIGKYFLKFDKFQFEIINSDIADKNKHQVAISFYTDPLVWHATIGDYILIAEPPQGESEEIITQLFRLQPYLTIHSLHPDD